MFLRRFYSKIWQSNLNLDIEALYKNVILQINKTDFESISKFLDFLWLLHKCLHNLILYRLYHIYL